jgi:hypothetical protein
VEELMRLKRKKDEIFENIDRRIYVLDGRTTDIWRK